MNEFLASNEWQWRLLHTVVQGGPWRDHRQPRPHHGLVRAGPQHACAHGGASDGDPLADHGGARRGRRHAADSEG